MPRGYLPASAGLALASCLALQIGCGLLPRRSTLPDALSDRDFWNLIVSLSEPSGAFTHSENLVSNEALYPHTIRRLRPRGGVYIGVGPEQNYSFIARLEPALAFIVDIRTENRNLHLLYKALFEASPDRSGFISRLFSRERPTGAGPGSTVNDLFAAYAAVKPDRHLYDGTRQMVRQRLVDIHGFPLSAGDLAWMERALEAFYTDGPEIHYGRSLPADASGPSYRQLMTAADQGGESRSYLASEEAFLRVKNLHAKNLIVPIVGDFGGVHTLRRAGAYVRQHDAAIEAFYGSNVEVYLNRSKLTAFCANLASMPVRSRTWYIDSKGMQTYRSKIRGCERR